MSSLIALRVRATVAAGVLNQTITGNAIFTVKQPKGIIVHALNGGIQLGEFNLVNHYSIRVIFKDTNGQEIQSGLSLETSAGTFLSAPSKEAEVTLTNNNPVIYFDDLQFAVSEIEIARVEIGFDSAPIAGNMVFDVTMQFSLLS